MPFIIAEPCVGTCDTACVEVYPDECIDCGACEPECPVEAIFEESEVPGEWEKYIKLNYDFFGREMQ